MSLKNRRMSTIDAQRVLASVNAKRALHGSPPLSWSPSIAKESQDWANKGVFQHSKNPKYSENLFMFNASEPGFERATNAWYSEEKQYDYNNPGFSPSTGHFSALVWKSSTEVGAGLAKMPSGMYIYVMNFSPRGNVNSPKMFTLNVVPPKKADS